MKSVLETVATNENGTFVANLESLPKDKNVTFLSIGVKYDKCFF